MPARRVIFHYRNTADDVDTDVDWLILPDDTPDEILSRAGSGREYQNAVREKARRMAEEDLERATAS